MAFGLGQHPITSVDQDDGELAGRCARDHVAGVLLVPWRVSDDELAPSRRKVSVGNIDSDALFTFGFEAIGEQGKVRGIACRSLGS